MANLSISKQQACKIVLLNQFAGSSGHGVNTTFGIINKLGYVQIDTISVVARAHHHTLWSRSANYLPEHLDLLQQNRQIFEYWSHAAAYLPMEDYRFCLPRMKDMSTKAVNWYPKAKEMTAHVLERIRDEGPLQSKDFEHKAKNNNGWWDWKPAKQALELLFMQGKLMIAQRHNFQKVFDLTERVLPDNIDTSFPSNEEYARYLIARFLKSHGLGNEAEFGYLRKGMKAAIHRELKHYVEKGEIIPLSIEGKTYYTTGSHLELLNQRLPKRRVKILSPFDNLLIQRKRLAFLFDYDYQLECYVPQDKRQFGYFCLPLLWGDQFIGRLDAKADRQHKNLIVQNIFIEKKPSQLDRFKQELELSLQQFAQFNGCEQIEWRQPISFIHS